ncbi:hypothetical protein BXZ70DRAFT_661942 [Cristinia sonorae]|uniref:Uncharacterized protein n=1 Tax=Cristinia sonorae TaxID=1940300 RepID=A0A8K0UDP3_9AGAR|nr:hypothetical protein BXZ70DRAFT_661942 [Cristinia sonorae]
MNIILLAILYVEYSYYCRGRCVTEGLVGLTSRVGSGYPRYPHHPTLFVYPPLSPLCPKVHPPNPIATTAEKSSPKLPTSLSGPKSPTTVSETAALDFLRRLGGLPVSRVLSWSRSGHDNSVGSEYLIM